MTSYLHHVPGRMRVRALAVKRNPAKAAVAQRALADVDGVLELDVRTVTGSITVTYDTDVTGMPAIVSQLQTAGIVTSDVPAAGAAGHGDSLTPQTEKVAKFVAGMALEKVLERSATALIAAIV